MAENKDAWRILAPRRTCHKMVAAAGMSSDPFELHGQIAIAVGDHAGQLVDLSGRFRRRFDLDPTSDAIENCKGIKRVGGRHTD
jgi:hypothetical protein